MSRILAVDDEAPILRMLQNGLKREGHDVGIAQTASDAVAAATERAPDLVILDLGLPDTDGVEVIRTLRGWSQVPILVLSGREEQSQKVAALDAGADDYVTKPFGMEELIARVRALLRRTLSPGGVPVLRFGDLEVDLTRRLVSRGGEAVHLTPTEYGLLEAMVTHPGKLLHHRWLLQKVWGAGYGVESHYLRLYVRQLRQKLGDEAVSPHLIATEVGLGYRWIPEPDAG